MARVSKIALGLSVVSLAASGAMAATVSQVIQARQQAYKQIGKNNKAIQDELKKDAPDLKAVNANAKQLEGLARRLHGWFPKGTGPETGVKTSAKAEIWTKAADFKQASQNFYGAAHQLNVVSAKADLGGTKAAAGTVGRTCKGCHDPFRAKDD